MSENDVFNAFSHLRPELQENLKLLFEERRHAPGQEVYLQGDPTTSVYVVAQGRVKLTRVARQGFESVLCMRRPGEYFCPVTVADRGPQLGTAVAMGEVVLLEADRGQFNALCEDNPELLAMVRTRIGSEVIKEFVLERNFVDAREKDEVVAELLTRTKENINGYLASPKFPAPFLDRCCDEARTACLAMINLPTEEQVDDDDGPTDFSGCFQD